MSTPPQENPPRTAGGALRLAQQHAIRARQLTTQDVDCHCGDEACPYRDKTLTASAAATANATTAAAWAAIAQAMTAIEAR